jgi:hypothetical protein
MRSSQTCVFDPLDVTVPGPAVLVNSPKVQGSPSHVLDENSAKAEKLKQYNEAFLEEIQLCLGRVSLSSPFPHPRFSPFPWTNFTQNFIRTSHCSNDKLALSCLERTLVSMRYFS